MRDTIKTILYATDLEPETGRACALLLQLTHALKADLHVLHVLEPSLTGGAVAQSIAAATSPSAKAEATQQIAAQLAELQAGWSQDARNTCIAKSISAIPGVATDTILLKADAVDADLIVVGAHRRGLLGRLLSNSTSKSIIAGATVPVLVVPLRE